MVATLAAIATKTLKHYWWHHILCCLNLFHVANVEHAALCNRWNNNNKRLQHNHKITRRRRRRRGKTMTTTNASNITTSLVNVFIVIVVAVCLFICLFLLKLKYKPHTTNKKLINSTTLKIPSIFIVIPTLKITKNTEKKQ